MVPNDFTPEEIERTRAFIANSVRSKSRFLHGRILGDPYVYYKDIADLLGYTIESESDGDRLGIIAGEASRAEYVHTGLLISAVVISKEFMRPGSGFYTLAEELGLYTIQGRRANADGANELVFWTQEVQKVVEHYGRR